MEAGRVVGIALAADAGAPMQELAEATLVAGVGIEGDRYALGTGHWMDYPDREVTLVEVETAEALGLAWSLLRRNVATRGVRLDRLEGATFRIGDAVLEGVRPCDPCRYLEDRVRPGLLKELTGRGGLRARVVAGGHVRVGDPVRLASR